MATYLLTWSPAAGTDWVGISKDARRLRQSRKLHYTPRWSVVRRSVEANSDVFLLRLGKDRPGIVAHGRIEGDVYEDDHWDTEKAEDGKTARYVDFKPDYIVDIENEDPLDIRNSRDPALTKLSAEIRHGLQGSGRLLQEPAATHLREVWNEYKAASVNQRDEMSDETLTDERFPEGGKTQITVNRYERNPVARQKCLARHGRRCVVCKMTFAEVYGEEFAKIIHVHHLTRISDLGDEYEVDPDKDLCPVCPNCHAALHFRVPHLTPEALAKRLRAAKSKGRP